MIKKNLSNYTQLKCAFYCQLYLKRKKRRRGKRKRDGGGGDGGSSSSRRHSLCPWGACNRSCIVKIHLDFPVNQWMDDGSRVSIEQGLKEDISGWKWCPYFINLFWSWVCIENCWGLFGCFGALMEIMGGRLVPLCLPLGCCCRSVCWES